MVATSFGLSDTLFKFFSSLIQIYKLLKSEIVLNNSQILKIKYENSNF